MPVDADDTLAKEVLYPDDLSGRTLEIDPDGLMNGTVQFWDADEEPTPDGAKHGLFFPADCADEGQVWVAAPRDLRKSLADLEPGDIFEVLSCEKAGPGETDPFYAEIAVITE